jgi:hypothetical protein
MTESAITSLEQADIALRVVKELAVEREAKGDWDDEVKEFWDKEIAIAEGVQFAWSERDSWGDIAWSELVDKINNLANAAVLARPMSEDFFQGVSTGILTVVRAALAVSASA